MGAVQFSVPFSERRGVNRLSHCHDAGSGEYFFVFPHDDHETADGFGWELNEEQMYFQTVNSQGPIPMTHTTWPGGRRRLSISDQNAEDGKEDKNEDEHSEEDEDEESVPDIARLSLTSTTPKSYEEIMSELNATASYRWSRWTSACVLNDISELQQLLIGYPDDNFFTRLDSHNGTSSVGLAACEVNGQETIAWLHSHGAAIDQPDHYGRTPLMEAALWGRLDTVLCLLQLGANNIAVDYNRMSAHDLAKDLPRNAAERLDRAGGVYREPLNCSRQRQIITSRLEMLDTAKPRTQQTSTSSMAILQLCVDGSTALYRGPKTLTPP